MDNKTNFNGVDPKHHTLLIVDDEPELREILALQFRRDGFTVFEASNGTEAFELVKSKKVDLVISDVQMPGGDGVELLDKLRTEHHEIPVLLFITGFTHISIEDAFNKGAEAIFSKPFNRKALLDAVLLSLTPKDQRWQSRPWRGESAFPIEITYPGFEKARLGKVINIGRGGFFVALDKIFPTVGDAITFKIQFTEGAVLCIEGNGVVRWVRSNSGEFPPGCGIEFVNLTTEARSQVMELINFLKTRQFIPKT